MNSIQRGASGLSISQEAVAVSAVQTHLRNAGVQGQLVDVRLHSRAALDELVVCGIVPMAGAQPIQVVAKVILNQATSIAQRSEAPRTGDVMVVMEAGPGLGRGGNQEGPVHRYCRDARVAPSAPSASEAIPAAGVQSEPDIATPPQVRVVVVTPVRIRAAPSGDGAILGTAQRQQSYVILGRAPGGWLLLGNGQETLGWAHSSLFTPAM